MLRMLESLFRIGVANDCQRGCVCAELRSFHRTLQSISLGISSMAFIVCVRLNEQPASTRSYHPFNWISMNRLLKLNVNIEYKMNDTC